MHTQVLPTAPAAAPAASPAGTSGGASAGTGGAASRNGFRRWECNQLTIMPDLSQRKRNQPPKPRPNDPKEGDLWRSEKGFAGWVLHWTYKRSKVGAPRSSCIKVPFWRYDPTKYNELLEKFDSESAAAGTAASGTGAAGGSAAAAMGAAAGPPASATSPAAGGVACATGGDSGSELFKQDAFGSATGDAGSSAAGDPGPAASTSAISASDDEKEKMNELYRTLRDTRKLPRTQVTVNGPDRGKRGQLYYISGLPKAGYQLLVDGRSVQGPPRGWKRPHSIYVYKPSG